MANKTYKKNDKTTKLSDNFKPYEFDCNGSGCCSSTKINPNLVTALQMIRTHFGKSVVINRGYTCPKHNATIKGAATKSQHLNGNAADIRVTGVDTIKVAYYIHNNLPMVKGLEVGTINANYIHLDVSGDTTSRKTQWCAICAKTGSYITVADLFPTLKQGKIGINVQMLTYALTKLKYLSGVSNSYTANIANAVKKFQTANKSKGISADGICGPKTWAVICDKL